MAALAGATRTNAGLLMRIYPDKKVATQINKTTKITNQFPRVKRAIPEGEKVGVAIELGLSDAGGYRSESDDNPEADRVDDTFGFFQYDAYRRTIQLSGHALHFGGDLHSRLSREVQGLVSAARLDRERDLFLSKRGEHAKCVSATSGTSFTVDNYQYMYKRQKIDVALLSNGSEAGGVTNATVLTITRDLVAGTAVVTIDKSLSNFAGIDSTYGVFKTNEYAKKPFGLPDIISTTNPGTGNYLEIDRTVETLWRGFVKDAGSSPPSGKLFAAVQTQLEIDGDDPASLIIVHPYVEQDLIRQAVVDRIYLKEKSFEIWGNRVTVNGVPVVGSRFCKFSDAWFLNMNWWELNHPPQVPSEGMWVSHGGPDGGTRLALVTNKWAHSALWVWAMQRVCRRCNAQGKIENLQWHPDGTA